MYFSFVDSSGLDNDNAESGIGTATPPKAEQVGFSISFYLYPLQLERNSSSMFNNLTIHVVVKYSFD